MRFLIQYSSTAKAKEKNLPLAGSVVHIDSLEDLLGLQARMGADLIIKKPERYGAPWWTEFEWDADEASDDHRVLALPDDFRSMPWIEVYNGLRE